MTQKNEEKKINPFIVILVFAAVVLVIFKLFFAPKPPPVKTVQALEKNEVFCTYAVIGSDMNALLLLSRNMLMQRIIIKDSKDVIVNEFVKELPLNAAKIVTKTGTFTAYGAEGNMHRFCEVKFKNNTVTERTLFNQGEGDVGVKVTATPPSPQH